MGPHPLHTTAHDMMRVLENYRRAHKWASRKEPIEAMMERPILADWQPAASTAAA